MSGAHHHGHDHGHDHAHRSERATLTSRAALASVAMALFLVALKSWASWDTGSVAMLGSLADTALDLIASLVTFFGVRWAAHAGRRATIASATARPRRWRRWSRSS